MAVEVFVGGLPPDVREEEVQQAFAAVGQVTGLRLNRRKRTGECKGFGFVRYADQGTAEKACSEVREVCVCAIKRSQDRGHALFRSFECWSPSLLLCLVFEVLFTLRPTAGLWQGSRCPYLTWTQC